MRTETRDLVLDWYHTEAESSRTSVATSPKVKGVFADDLSVFSDGFESIVMDNCLDFPLFRLEDEFQTECVEPEKKFYNDDFVETRSTISVHDTSESLEGPNDDKDAVDLYEMLKERFTGHKGNEMVMELIEIAKSNIFDGNFENKEYILNSELEKLLNFSKRRNMRQRACAQFNLPAIIINDTQKISQSDITRLVESYKDLATYNSAEKTVAIKRYLSKRNSRKISKTVRYNVRSNFAAQRPRANGKFMKKTRIDMKKVAEEVYNKE